jgi:hypothetical protein
LGVRQAVLLLLLDFRGFVFHDGRGAIVGNVHEHRRTDADEDDKPEGEFYYGFSSDEIHSEQ